MILSVSFFLSLLVLCAASSCHSHGWIPFNGHCYMFYDGKKTWYEAKRACNDLGGYLVRIESWTEENWLRQQAAGHDNFVNHGYYTGATDSLYEGSWVWESNGEQMAVWDFSPGEPNGKRSENCFLIHRSDKNGSRPYRFHDVACSRKEKFICEKDTQ